MVNAGAGWLSGGSVQNTEGVEVVVFAVESVGVGERVGQGDASHMQECQGAGELKVDTGAFS